MNNLDYQFNYNNIDLIELSENLYNKGFSGIDLIDYIDSIKEDSNITKYKTITIFEYLVREFRNEKLIIYFMLNYIFFRFNYNIKKFL